MNSLSPSYICPNAASDLFTLSGNAKGNGALTYPIAIPTLDDVIYAGISPGYINRKTFVNGDTYWLMTPYVNSSAYGMPFISVLSGDGLTAYSGLSSNFLARPVINLKADTEIVSGIGTKNAPFIIK